MVKARDQAQSEARRRLENTNTINAAEQMRVLEEITEPLLSNPVPAKVSVPAPAPETV
jgi:hypothetical protein